MKNQLNLIFLAFIFFYSASAIYAGSGDEFSATYSFKRNGETTPLILLDLNADNTFVYIDKSNPNKPVSTKGTYTKKGKTIKLSGYQSEHSIAKKWKIDEKYNCIKSRKALRFTRICSGDC